MKWHKSTGVLYGVESFHEFLYGNVFRSSYFNFVFLNLLGVYDVSKRLGKIIEIDGLYSGCAVSEYNTKTFSD
jgi:hypothetical protein